ncbi:MAG: anti-sigma F factor [Firmicutes bacterium]|nr:anti-sigma F factor [Bacillota bacterium]NLL88034.1 anti-sigma F factor [Bacillota bacterium]HKM17261.1 anti-sigma F factor [Limnochordia bacterium]
MEVKNWVRLEFPSESENVLFARTAVAVFASQLDFTLEEIEDIKVAVSEAVSNCVIHAYGDCSGNIVVICKYSIDELEITVEDNGCGIPDIVQASEAGYTTIPEERMGLGLVFIHELMDHVAIASEVGKGTKLLMAKRIPRSRE